MSSLRACVMVTILCVAANACAGFARASPGQDTPAPAPAPAPKSKSKSSSGKSSGPNKPEVGTVLRGKASWYGGTFHGRKTASGERFDKHALTAAHRTLPFGTIVKVENLDNERSVKVRINDRGPFGKKTRIIDVSRAAADKLGMIKRGVVSVSVTIVRLPAKPKPKPKKRRRRRGQRRR